METTRVRVYIDGHDLGPVPVEAVPALKEYFRSMGMAKKVKTVLEIKEVAASDKDGKDAKDENWILCKGTVTTPEEHAKNVLGPKTPFRGVELLSWSARKRAELMELLAAPDARRKNPELEADIRRFLETGDLSPRLASVAVALMEKQQGKK